MAVESVPSVLSLEDESQGGRRIGLVRRVWTTISASARYERLEGALRIARIEIERRHQQSDQPPWEAAAQRLLQDADSCLVRGKLDQAWRLLHAARTLEILGIDQAEELTGTGIALRAEAEKLRGWRQTAVQAIIGTIKEPRPANVAAISAAALIRDEHYNNQAYKDQLLRTQILFLALILAVVMASIMGLSLWNRLPLAQTPPPAFETLVAVMLFGNLGGTVSAMLRASDATSSARIPEITSAMRVTFMRILMGGGSAIVIHLALQSQVTGMFNESLAKTLKSLNAETTYVVAFVAGFTERLVLRAVEYVAGKQEPAVGTKPKPEPGA